jgi:hypothetical protein
VANLPHSLLLLIVGAVVFFVFSFVMPASKAHLSELDEVALKQQWNSVVGSNYSPEEWLQIKQDAKDQQILHLRAISLGLHKKDTVVSQRLKLLSEYLNASDVTDFEYSDEIIRRRLIQLMEERLIDEADIVIADIDVADYYNLNTEKYLSPPRVSFKHKFFAIFDQSKNDLLRFNNGSDIEGDPFLAGSDFVKISESSVNKLFAPGFFTKINLDNLKQWQGPIDSAFGHHWVFLQGYFPPQPLNLQTQRQRIRATLYEKRRKEVLTAKLIGLRNDYHNGWVISPHRPANPS